MFFRLFGKAIIAALRISRQYSVFERSWAALMFHRYFRGHVDELVVTMEQEALKMVEAMHGPDSEQA